MTTAVEWLVEQLKVNNYLSENAHWLIGEAKELEKQQIIDAFNLGQQKEAKQEFWTKGNQYYNETFNK